MFCTVDMKSALVILTGMVYGWYLQIWNIKSSKCTAEFVGHSSHINCFDYFSHGDELYMITGSRDRTAKVRD